MSIEPVAEHKTVTFKFKCLIIFNFLLPNFVMFFAHRFTVAWQACAITKETAVFESES